jgi:hypothetical protein
MRRNVLIQGEELGGTACEPQWMLHFLTVMHLSAGDANGDTDAIVSSLVQVMLSPGCRTIAGMMWHVLEPTSCNPKNHH